VLSALLLLCTRKQQREEDGDNRAERRERDWY
jgi:hypothetical protein